MNIRLFESVWQWLIVVAMAYCRIWLHLSAQNITGLYEYFVYDDLQSTNPMHYHHYRCLNEGTCQDLINDFRCRCPSIRYAGRFCEIDLLNLPGSRSYPAVSVIDNAQGIVDSHFIIL